MTTLCQAAGSKHDKHTQRHRQMGEQLLMNSVVTGFLNELLMFRVFMLSEGEGFRFGVRKVPL